MRLVTVATREDGYMPYLRVSCERHGARLEVLGWRQAWRGWTWRMRLVRDFFASCAPDELVCFVDAYDVLLLRPLADLEAGFRRLVPAGDRVVVAHDYAQPPLGEVAGAVMFGKCRGVRVNAGTYVGRAAVLVRMVDRMAAAAGAGWFRTTDDQVMMTRLCSSDPHAFHVDVRRELFLTVANHWRNLDMEAAGVAVVDGRLRYAPTGTEPCVLHTPASTRLDAVLWRLGYPVAVVRGLGKPVWQRVLEASVVLLATTCVIILLVSRRRGGDWCACPRAITRTR